MKFKLYIKVSHYNSFNDDDLKAAERKIIRLFNKYAITAAVADRNELFICYDVDLDYKNSNNINRFIYIQYYAIGRIMIDHGINNIVMFTGDIPLLNEELKITYNPKNNDTYLRLLKKYNRILSKEINKDNKLKEVHDGEKITIYCNDLQKIFLVDRQLKRICNERIIE